MGMIGYSDPLVELPEVSTLVIALNMAVPMVAWMRFRHHEWAPRSGRCRGRCSSRRSCSSASSG
jgi:hypothetical protein